MCFKKKSEMFLFDCLRVGSGLWGHCLLLKNIFAANHKGEGVPWAPLPVWNWLTTYYHLLKVGGKLQLFCYHIPFTKQFISTLRLAIRKGCPWHAPSYYRLANPILRVSNRLSKCKMGLVHAKRRFIGRKWPDSPFATAKNSRTCGPKNRVLPPLTVSAKKHKLSLLWFGVSIWFWYLWLHSIKNTIFRKFRPDYSMPIEKASHPVQQTSNEMLVNTSLDSAHRNKTLIFYKKTKSAEF